MTSKVIKSIKKAYQEFNNALEKELNALDIDTEKLLQSFYMFIENKKYTLTVTKSPENYVYKVTLKAPTKDNPCYICIMNFDIYTGNAKILQTSLNSIAI